MDNVADYLSFLGLNAKKEPEDKKPKPPYPGTLAPLRAKLKTDEYMSRVDVEDHIIPIWERETEVSAEKEPVEDLTLSYSYSLLSFVSRSITEGTVSSYESDEFEILSDSDIEENEVRGVYLHKLQHIANTDFPSPDAYPVYIKGSPINSNVVECVDASAYAQQFPVILFEWFIGTEYNSVERYSPEPLATGKTFEIPVQAIGKHIFCRAHRLVEAQLTAANMFPNSGTYDPHVNVFYNEYPNQKKFHNVSTLCSAGPVDISNDLALKLLENLSEDYSTSCTLCYNSDFTSSVTYEKSRLLNQSVDLELHISSKLTLDIPPEAWDRHSIFRIDFFDTNQGSPGEEDEFISFELYPDKLVVQEPNNSESEILFGTYHDDKVKHYFSLRFEDRIQCLIVLYTIYCFFAHQKMRLPREAWSDALNTGDLDYVVRIVREYLSSL